MSFKVKEKNRGITLIALVVTIIVLLILAGISITMLTGQNGILNRAQEAKEKTEDAVLEEKIKLLTAETLINEYTGQEEEKTAQELQNELNNQGENVLVIQWDKYIIFDLNKNKEYRVTNDGSIEYWGETTLGQTLLNAKTANEDQVAQDGSTSNIIGIDNDGNTVNMLLWEYTLIDDSALGKVGTYGLNDKNGLDGSGASGRSEGYIGEYTEDGKIIGTVPAYISEDGGNSYISVTSMAHTFYACNDLIIAPEIADTVTNMQVTFYKATNLTTSPSKIPDSTTNLAYTFLECEKLSSLPELGINIKDMTSTFQKCTSLTYSPEIPKNTINMTETFKGCTNLVEFNSNIPNSVTNMSSTFYGCTSLVEFNSNIPNNVTNMRSTFNGCTSLVEFNSNIPNNVTNMILTFNGCTSLVEFNSNIPNNVTNMTSTFNGCTSLVEFNSNIPNSVTNMQSTFYRCSSLEIGPQVIPNSVKNLFQTFGHCSNLQGKIVINANIGEDIVYEWNENKYKGYDETFINAGINGEGIIIAKESTCNLEILNKWILTNSKITLEQ